MTREDITRMAREAGFVGFDGENKCLRKFSALVAAAERSACAKPRQWQGLTSAERNEFRQWAHPEIIEAIELKLKERNV